MEHPNNIGVISSQMLLKKKRYILKKLSKINIYVVCGIVCARNEEVAAKYCFKFNCLYKWCTVNPLSADPGYIRDFRKILPFLLKSRFLLLSLHLYTKRICGFDSPLNFEETGAKKVPNSSQSDQIKISKRHQKR